MSEPPPSPGWNLTPRSQYTLEQRDPLSEPGISPLKRTQGPGTLLSSLTRSISHSHICRHSHTNLHTNSHAFIHMLTLTFTPSHTLTLSLRHIHTLSHSYSHISHPQLHSHIYTLSCTLTLMLSSFTVTLSHSQPHLNRLNFWGSKVSRDLAEAQRLGPTAWCAGEEEGLSQRHGGS